jgi:hypothetical protein
VTGARRAASGQTTATEDFLFPIYVDFEGKGQFMSGEWPRLRVEGVELAGLTVLAPSVVATGETFDLTVRAEDRHLNRTTSAIPAWEVVRNGKVVKEVAAGGPALQLVSGLSIDQPGFHRFVVRSADGAERHQQPRLASKSPATCVFWARHMVTPAWPRARAPPNSTATPRTRARFPTLPSTTCGWTTRSGSCSTS